MRIVITGATGFIGTHLAASLQGGTRLSRWVGASPRIFAGMAPGDAPSDAFEGADAVVHLAGEPVAQRWSADVKQRIRDSRVLGTERVIHGLSICRKTRSRPAWADDLATAASGCPGFISTISWGFFVMRLRLR
jgi:NAD dependent epimerase/dehydratase family enzyme